MDLEGKKKSGDCATAHSKQRLAERSRSAVANEARWWTIQRFALQAVVEGRAERVQRLPCTTTCRLEMVRGARYQDLLVR